MSNRKINLSLLAVAGFALLATFQNFTYGTLKYSSNIYSLQAGGAVSIVPTVSGISEASLECTAIGLPPGLVLNPTNCAISGVAANVPFGVPGPTIIHSPYVLSSVFLQFEIAPSYKISFSPSYQIQAGQPVHIAPVLTGFAPNQPPNCFVEDQAVLPPGLHMDPFTCSLTGIVPLGYIAPVGERFEVLVQAPPYVVAPIVFQLIVSDAYSIRFLPSYQVVTGEFINIAPQVSGVGVGPILQCNATGLPAGLYLNPVTCAISGVIPPQAVDPRGQMIPIVIHSPYASAPIDFFLNITQRYRVSFPATDFNVVAGQPVNIAAQLTGFGPGQPAQCTTTRPLPPGLFLDPIRCVILGTIELGIVQAQGEIFFVTVQTPYSLAPIPLILSVSEHYQISFNPSYQLTAGGPVQIRPLVSGFAPGEPLQCTALSPLPPGLVLNPVTCAISGQLAPANIARNYSVFVRSPFVVALIPVNLVVAASPGSKPPAAGGRPVLQ